MSETSTPGIGDLINLLSANNPLAAVGKSIEQFKRGVNEFLHTVETFNETMATINALAARATVLFDEFEEPMRTVMPQVTRSLKAADMMITQISGPIDKVAPRLSQLADTLGSPVFTSMPNDLAGFLDTLGDLTKRLQPLAQLAENAGGLFGMRSFASLLGGNSAAAPSPPPSPPVVLVDSATRAPAARGTNGRPASPESGNPALPAAMKTGAKKAGAKKAGAKKAGARKAGAKKAGAKASAPTARRSAARSVSSTRKSSPR